MPVRTRTLSISPGWATFQCLLRFYKRGSWSPILTRAQGVMLSTVCCRVWHFHASFRCQLLLQHMKQPFIDRSQMHIRLQQGNTALHSGSMLVAAPEQLSTIWPDACLVGSTGIQDGTATKVAQTSACNETKASYATSSEHSHMPAPRACPH